MAHQFTQQQLEEFKKHNFSFYNCNPAEVVTDDCVIRAISTGEEVSWEQTLREMTEYAIKYGFMMHTANLYSIYLKDKGWIKHDQLFTKSGKEIKVRDLAKKIKGKVIVDVGGFHISYIKDGLTMDIWDCTEFPAREYWTKD